MEIDVREEKEGKPDVIRFSNMRVLEKCDEGGFYISVAEGSTNIGIAQEDVPNLIKALKKYQELYGED